MKVCYVYVQEQVFLDFLVNDN